MGQQKEEDKGIDLAELVEEIESSRVAILAAEERIRKATSRLSSWIERRSPGSPGALTGAQARPFAQASSADSAEAPPRSPVDYLRMISHDTKEPLRGIVYFGQLLVEEYGERLDQEGRDYLGYIRAAAQRMSMLLSDAVLLARLESRGPDRHPVDLRALVRGLIEELDEAIKAKEGEVTYKGDLPVLDSDPVGMQELFRRLLKNAIQYSNPPMRVEIGVEGPHDGYFLFHVRDWGIGIEPQYLEQIFELFQRLHSWEDYEGTGIGLTICRQVVQVHNGRIWVESKPKEGATFYFTLPDTSQIY